MLSQIVLEPVLKSCYTWHMAPMMADTARPSQLADLVGTWRRFGTIGPVYEIVGVGSRSSGADPVMRVRVVESGEELDYRLAEILADPREG